MSINAKHRRTLEELFVHPVSMNIEFSKVVALFDDLGAVVSETKKNHVKVKLNGQEMTFSRPHHKNIDDKHEILAIRDFLKKVGATPDAEER